MKKVLLSICISVLTIASKRQTSLKVISDLKVYNELPDTKKLVLLTDSVPNIQQDLVYATTHNFTKKKLYPFPKLYVNTQMASALKKAAKILQAKGLGLLIYDGYRPYSVSKKMWEIVQDTRYVANPINGSDHNKGAAIDLSLYNLKTGKALLMPTPFDDFTEKAHLSYNPSSATIRTNRALLIQTMQSVGLHPLATEWWHYTLSNSKSLDVLDISFKDLEK